MRKSTTAFAAALAMLAIPVSAFADDSKTIAPKPSLVALGDSITFGYNLADTDNNTTPSQHAFPQLLGAAEGMQVTNLGKPGWTSSDLLKALQSDTTFQTDVKQANLITLDIGSNDLLHLAAPLLDQVKAGQPVTVTPELLGQFQQAVVGFGQNLPQIVTAVRGLTKAPILLYNLYNPFTPGTDLGNLGEQMLPPMNAIITKTASATGCTVVDAYDAYNKNQAQLVRPADVHPTLIGQYALAQMADNALYGEGPVTSTLHGKAKYGLTYNGVTVTDPAAHTRLVGRNWTMYASVDLFAKVYGVASKWDPKTGTLTINGVKVNSAYGKAYTHMGVLTAPVMGMTRAYMASIGTSAMDTAWISSTNTANVTVLPKGYVSTHDVVPQMGVHWVDPKNPEYGLIFGTYHGKLVFEEYMYDQPDSATQQELGVPHHFGGIPVPKFNHFELNPEPNGHPGMEKPHVDEHMYFISSAEQNQIQ